MSRRERGALAALGVILMFALAVGLWFLTQADAWKKSARKYREAVDRYRAECRLIAEKGKWTDAYEEEKARMPTFAAGKDTDTVWLDRLIALANRYHVTVSEWKPSKEASPGDVTELEMEARNFECSLEMLVGFLHALETTKDGMFDVKLLSFKPQRNGFLKGTMTIKCAYMRE